MWCSSELLQSNNSDLSLSHSVGTSGYLILAGYAGCPEVWHMYFVSWWQVYQAFCLLQLRTFACLSLITAFDSAGLPAAASYLRMLSVS